MNSNEPNQPVVLNEINLSFSSLVLFFVKCALALIPASIIFIMVMWFAVGLAIGGVAAVTINPRGFFLTIGIAVFIAGMAWLLDFTSRNLTMGRRARLRR